MTKEEKIVLDILESMGFNPVKIEEDSVKKSPDLFLESNEINVLIEIKSKFDDVEAENKKNERLLKGEIVNESFYTTRKNNLSNVIRSACSQLRAKKDKADLYFIWLMAANSKRQITIEQFVATLYGSVDIIDWYSDDKMLKPCYYFENSEFFNHRDILDGAIVASEEKGMFCINTLSERYTQTLEFSLTKKFGDVVIDPIASERNKTGYIIDTDINRNEKDEIIKFLRTKYKNDNLGECNLGHHSGTMLIDK